MNSSQHVFLMVAFSLLYFMPVSVLGWNHITLEMVGESLGIFIGIFFICCIAYQAHKLEENRLIMLDKKLKEDQRNRLLNKVKNEEE